MDNDAKRIIESKYGFEILGIGADESIESATSAWRLLNKKFNVRGGDQFKFDNRYISSDLGKKLLEYINGKINFVDRSNIRQIINDSYNWEDFYYYAGMSRNN